MAAAGHRHRPRCHAGPPPAACRANGAARRAGVNARDLSRTRGRPDPVSAAGTGALGAAELAPGWLARVARAAPASAPARTVMPAGPPACAPSAGGRPPLPAGRRRPPAAAGPQAGARRPPPAARREPAAARRPPQPPGPGPRQPPPPGAAPLVCVSLWSCRFLGIHHAATRCAARSLADAARGLRAVSS